MVDWFLRNSVNMRDITFGNRTNHKTNSFNNTNTISYNPTNTICNTANNTGNSNVNKMINTGSSVNCDSTIISGDCGSIVRNITNIFSEMSQPEGMYVDLYKLSIFSTFLFQLSVIGV